MNALGIDLGGTKIEAALLDGSGALRWRQRVPTPQEGFDAVVRAVVGLAEAARAAGHGPFSIGLAHPGALTADGRIKNSNSRSLNGRPLLAVLEQALGQRIGSANDANCLALSEATDGAGAGFETVFAVILGTGVGGAWAVNGRVLQGANRLAGEWGHVPLPWGEDADEAERAIACWCGRRGCIEALLSGPALAADHARVNGIRVDAPTAEAIAAAAAAGSPEAAATLERHAARLARALAMAIDVLDPDVIVLGGGLSKLASLYDRVPRLWGRWIVGAADEPVRTRLLPARHGDASGVRGAAWLGRAAGVAPR